MSGLLLLIENQIRVSDVAVINGKGGLVEEINLRTTVLRGEDGAVHIFAEWLHPIALQPHARIFLLCVQSFGGL